MKKLMVIPLLLLAPLISTAACVVRPITDAYVGVRCEVYNGVTYDEGYHGQVMDNSECRGVGEESALAAVHYAFSAKAGDSVKVFINQPGRYTKGIGGRVTLVDPSGVSIAYTRLGIPDRPNQDPPPPDSFVTTLPSSGLYKLIITNASNYCFLPVVPLQVTENPTCPVDRFSNGELVLNAVSATNGLGEIVKYKATLGLRLASNPAVFTVNKLELLQ